MKPLFRSLASILALALCLCTAPLLVSCSDWDQDLTKATSDSSETDDADLTSESEESTYQQHELVTLVNEYMQTLITGDPDAVCQKFGLNRIEVLYPSREDVDEIYSILSRNANFYIGGVLSTRESSFSVDTVYCLPDIRSCYFEVLADTTFMETASREWIDAMLQHTEVDAAREKMIDAAFREALRRINDGEYKEYYSQSGSFKFHKNPDRYVLEQEPEFVTFFGYQERIAHLRYVDSIEEYNFLVTYLAVLVEKGEVEKTVADTILLEKKEEMQGAF